MYNININTLLIEVTRRCNLKCLHCMRGKSQDIDMTEEILDEFFFNRGYKICVGKTSLCGGEPTLNDKIIDYLIKITKKGVEVGPIMAVINGTTYNERFVEKLIEYAILSQEILEKKGVTVLGERKSYLDISTDKYHPNLSQMIYDNYKKWEQTKRLSVSLHGDLDGILNIGNAKDNNIGTEPFNEPALTKKLRATSSSMDIENHLAIRHTYLNALGYVTGYPYGTYEIMDKLNLGNISDKSFLDMIDNESMLIYKF